MVKLIFFDMDGTLYEGNTWDSVARSLGNQCYEEEQKTVEKWKNNEYKDYIEWMDETVKIHKKYGLTKKKFFDILNSFVYHENVVNTVKELKKRGYKIALISGGFMEKAKIAIEDMGFDHVFAACEYIWDEEGNIDGANYTECDYIGKVHHMQHIMEIENLEKEECAFVGDGHNDVFLAKAVGFSVDFNGVPELKEVTNKSIVKFEELLEIFK